MTLVRAEAETHALQAFLDGFAGPRLSNALARVEVLRAVLRFGADDERAARRVLSGIDEIALDRSVLDRAATLPVGVRSLDAIHLASALRVGRHLTALVTDDRRLVVAADALGVPVAAPG